MRVLVTGATGVLGSRLTRGLLARNCDVVALSRSGARLSRIADLPISVFSMSPEGIRTALSLHAIDAAIHTAACYGRAGEQEAELIEANFLLPQALAIAGGTRIGRWIVTGTALPPSVSAYTMSKGLFADWLERAPTEVIGPRDLLLMEQFYGPGDNPHSFLTKIARECILNNPIDLTEGAQERDFLHLDDTVGAILAVLDHPGPGFRKIPVGSGTTVPIRHVVERIHAIAGSRSILRFGTIPMRKNEPPRCVADTAQLRLFGWQPRISLDEGLVDLVNAERVILKSTQ